MEQTQQIVLEKNGNGRHLQPVIPLYTAPFLENNKPDEWNLRQFLAVLRRRAIVIGSVAIALSASFWFSTLSRQAKYEGKFMLLVEPVTAQSKLAGLSEISGTSAPPQESLDYDTLVLVLQSPELMTPIVEKLSIRYPDISYGSLIANLKISRFQETKILEVNYQDTDPQKVQFILQHLAKEYLKYSLHQRQTNLGQGIQFVDHQLPKLQSQVNSLQKELQKFRQKYNFIDPEVKAEQLSDLVSSVKQQQININNQITQTRAYYKTLKGESGVHLAQTHNSQQTSLEKSNGAEALVEKEAPVYENLVGKLRNVEGQIAAELARFREDSPTIRALRQQRDNLQPVLQQEANRVLGNKLIEVANHISLLELQAAEIAQADRHLAQKVKQLPVLTRQYTDLQRELKIATESLNRFLEKRQSLQIESAQKEIPWQMVSAPQLPQAPLSADLKRNLFLGAIAGVLAGVGAGLLVERLDNVFHSADDLKEVTKLPLLGVIPFYQNLKQFMLKPEVAAQVTDPRQVVSSSTRKSEGYSYFPFLEAFRSLHTNIGFLGSDTPIHSVVISSAVHADGKSTVALHLAQAAAAMGQRVLLVDADLRRPQLHHLLGLTNDQGLSNIISLNLPVSEAIQQCPLSNNLFVLTAGQIPPDPTKLLASKKMQSIMEQLRQQFDFVIYDTPPLLGLADSSLLATYTSGIVLVVRMAKTDRSILAQALEGLRISRAAILGTVCNSAINYHNSAYSYYYRPRQSAELN